MPVKTRSQWKAEIAARNAKAVAAQQPLLNTKQEAILANQPAASNTKRRAENASQMTMPLKTEFVIKTRSQRKAEFAEFKLKLAARQIGKNM